MIARGLVVLASLALLAACTTRRPALLSPDAGPAQVPITTCDEALGAEDGTLCEGIDRCVVRSSPCCLEEVVCSRGSLVRLSPFCEPGCRPCASDRECAPGTLCEPDRCVACPSEMMGCPPCPDGLRPRLRNGCETCECAPPSECRVPEDCPMGLECYPGQACDPFCMDGSTECCANVCALPGCFERAPLGCATLCPPELSCEGRCVAVRCACDGRTWRCESTCAPPGVVLPPC
jgi:hypothetical protein